MSSCRFGVSLPRIPCSLSAWQLRIHHYSIGSHVQDLPPCPHLRSVSKTWTAARQPQPRSCASEAAGNLRKPFDSFAAALCQRERGTHRKESWRFKLTTTRGSIRSESVDQRLQHPSGGRILRHPSRGQSSPNSYLSDSPKHSSHNDMRFEVVDASLEGPVYCHPPGRKQSDRDLIGRRVGSSRPSSRLSSRGSGNG